jgi:hypothetical protein
MTFVRTYIITELGSRMHSFLLTRFSQNLSPRRAVFYPQIFLKSQKVKYA